MNLHELETEKLLEYQSRLDSKSKELERRRFDLDTRISKLHKEALEIWKIVVHRELEKRKEV